MSAVIAGIHRLASPHLTWRHQVKQDGDKRAPRAMADQVCGAHPGTRAHNFVIHNSLID